MWDNFLFDLANELTLGLVTDSKTMLAAFVVLGFLAFGADILLEKLQGAAASRSFGQAQTFYELRNASGKGSMEYDYYNAMYRSNLNQSLAFNKKAGGDFYVGLGAPDDTTSSVSESSSFFKGDTEFDSLAAQGESLEDLFPELSDSSDDPGPLDDDRPYWA